MNQLAIEGGRRAISQNLVNEIPVWPVVWPETADKLKQLYLSRNWSFNGSYEQAFARRFAQYHSCSDGILMVNGTVTLQCALQTVGVSEGDEVIVPALAWMATAMAPVYLGATPVFVDIEPDTLCIDPKAVEKSITKKTKAIVPVHLYGSMADMEAVMDIAKKHGLTVIEDCAHAHGGMWNGRGVGSIGQIGSFSFQQSKTLTSGEGGACITNDADLAEKLYRLKHIGYGANSAQGAAQSSPPEGFICSNFRATEFQALILLDGLEHLAEQTRKRDENAKYLADLLRDVPGVKVQSRGRLADVQGYYALVLLFDPGKFNGVGLDRLLEILGAEGLGIGKTYGPVYKHTLWNVPSSRFRIADGCPVCENTCDHAATTIGQTWLLAERPVIEAIAETIKKVVSKKR